MSQPNLSNTPIHPVQPDRPIQPVQPVQPDQPDQPVQPDQPPVMIVSPEEADQKLLQFLARRLDVPPGMLHRWIRTGQVRVDGGRVKAFARLAAGAHVRLPPFAMALARPVVLSAAPDSMAAHRVAGQASRPALAPEPDASSAHHLAIVLENHAVLVCNKPAGLPVHPGTGHTDSLTTRLAARHAGSAFMPTPAHRLDKNTSGLMLIAKTYGALRAVHEALNTHCGVHKEYLVWVCGASPWTDPQLLVDVLCKQTVDASGNQRMERVSALKDGTEARLSVRCLCVATIVTSQSAQAQPFSLLQVVLHTGRTHQIRAQLSLRGHPLMGDPKYGGPLCPQGMLLHAARLHLDAQPPALPQVDAETLPPWHGPWQVTELPPLWEGCDAHSA